MSSQGNVVRGALKIIGVLEEQFFTSITDFIKKLPMLFGVEIPISDITNVTVGNTQPRDDQRDHVWFRFDNGGSFVGIYVYTNAAWTLMFYPNTQLIRMIGDSRNVPAGFLLADTNNPNLTANLANQLMAQWIKDPTLVFYQIFDVTYSG